ncbi:MAG: 16S rRNA (uracil(1498)-N(3))-methyltransferase [Salaquimonas sp.]
MERYDFKTQRLFVDQPLAGGAAFEADRAQANYLLNVLRLKDGAKVLIFNGIDGEWLTSIGQSGRKACKLKIEYQIRPQPAPSSLIYCFAPLKQGRLDYMIQKAVEMGAGVLQPVITQHTQITKLNMERVKANALEAAEQCGILSIPTINKPVKLTQFLIDWDKEHKLLFADESADDVNPISALSDISRTEQKGLLVGPEGGFSAEERKALLTLEYVRPISLGPRILRADTAAVAALAVIQSACGDW